MAAANKTHKHKSGDESYSETLEVNKKARREYEILETLEAGISLLGSELKSIRSGGLSLKESYVQIKSGECFLMNAHIAPYAFTSVSPPDPYRTRKLLLHKREIERLGSKNQQKGLTMIPLSCYSNAKGKVKIQLGVGRGKKLHDKREDMKSKEATRSMERVLKQKR
ncbi:MAG TPA: SsrA-binding protein SmpB [Oligoflexia bacterium]|nr:SsrA-binding protein SmpB [Oligoflexia bacterium]HMP47854.1 SsrA-binding protein SmpB [Oligoflexia bacterium]